MKKYFVIFLSLILFNCSSKKSDKIEIEFWTLQLSPLFNDYFNELIKEFEASNPSIKVKWVDVPYDAVIHKLLAALSADDAPDVVNLSSDFLSKFYNLNTLYDLTPHLSKEYLNEFLPNALESNIFDNKIIALPWYQNTYTLIYNKKYLEEAGFTEKDVPKTFDELIKFTRLYKDRTGKYGLFCNLGKDSFLPLILEAEGVHLTNPEMTRATFNTDRGVEIFEKWINLYKDGYLQSESIIKTGTALIEAYQSGQVAMVFTGPVFLKRVRDNAPEIYKVTDVAPALLGATGKHELAGMSIAVMATTKNPDASIKFLKFVLSKENQLKFSKLATIYPSTKESLKDEYFTKMDGTLETKARVIGAEQLSTATRLSKYLLHPKFDQLREAFSENVQAACKNKITVKDAVKKLSMEWDKILNSN